jgi:hypothetical protein
MSLTLELPSHLEERLREAASERGLDAEEYAVRLLEHGLPPTTRAERNCEASELLRRWREEGDEEEQRETGEYLMRALNEARSSGRGVP